MESALKWSRKAVEVAEADEGGDPETLEHLKNELKSYEEGKPWRELMTPSGKSQAEESSEGGAENGNEEDASAKENETPEETK